MWFQNRRAKWRRDHKISSQQQCNADEVENHTFRRTINSYTVLRAPQHVLPTWSLHPAVPSAVWQPYSHFPVLRRSAFTFRPHYWPDALQSFQLQETANQTTSRNAQGYFHADYNCEKIIPCKGSQPGSCSRQECAHVVILGDSIQGSAMRAAEGLLSNPSSLHDLRMKAKKHETAIKESISSFGKENESFLQQD